MRPISRIKRMSEAGRSLLRPRFAARAALLALSLLAASPAAAGVLVSNIGRHVATNAGLNDFDLAQGFTTGSQSGGYILESVEVRFTNAPSGVTVKLATGLPSATTEVATLTNPSSLAAGNLTFTAPANTTLSASTTYFVVVEGSSGLVSFHNSGIEDSGGAAGWSMPDKGRWRNHDSSGAWSELSTDTLMIRVNGTLPGPAFSSATVNGTALKVTFAENLAAAASLANSAFTVKKTPTGGMETDASLTGTPSISGKTVTLTLATAAVSSDAFTVAYTKPTTGSNNKLKGTGSIGGETDSFGAKRVTNLSTASVPAACGTAGSVDIFSEITSTATSITVTLTGGSTPNAELKLCGPFGTGGAVTTATVLDGITLGFQSLTVTHTGLNGTGSTLQADTDYWVHVDSYARTSRWYHIRTAASAVNSAPTVENAIPDRAATADTAFSFQFASTAFNDLDGDALTYTATKPDDSALPSWLTFTAGTRTFSGTPASGDVGTLSVKVTASDGTASVSDEFDIVVSAAPDTAPPTVSSASVDGTALTITFNENLATTSVPPNSAFTVKRTRGGTEATVSLSSTAPSISGATVTLTLGAAVLTTDTDVKVSYAKPASGKLQDAAANEVAAFTDQAVTNVDTAPPTVASATANGTALTITFNENLAAAAVPISAFTVKKTPAGGSETTVTLGTVNPVVTGKNVVMTLGSPLLPSDGSVKVSYTQPASAANRLKDASDNEVANFSDQAVTNTTPLTVTAVAVSSDAGDDDTYALGEKIQVRVTFNDAVTVDTTGGTPSLTIKMDPDFGEKQALYESGSGTANLLFAYTTESPNKSTQGIAVLENTLALNGGTIKAGAKDAALAHAGLAHDSSHKIDTKAPEVSSASVNGTTLTITFDEDLGAAADLANSAFAVKRTRGGMEATVDLSSTAPSISGTTVTLTLAAALLNTDTAVKVSYEKPSSGTNNKLVDVPGNEAADFTDQAVTNATPDTTAPTVSSASVNGTALTITFNENLVDTTVVPNSAFAVKRTRGGTEATVDLSSTVPSISGMTVTLTLATAVLSTDTGVKVSYAKRTTGTNNKLTDVADNEVANFTDQAVTNATAPSVASASVNGKALTITFNETLGAAGDLPNSAFMVKKTPDGESEEMVSLGATAPSISGKTVTLTLAAAVVSTDGSVKVSYAKPSGGTNNKLKDAADNEVPDFTDQAVTNNDMTAPTVSSAAVNRTALTITFDEDLAAAANLANGAFEVKRTRSGTEAIVSLSTTAPAISGKTVTLTLADALLETDTAVKVSYTKPSNDDGNRLEDSVGNEVASFTGRAVTNETTAGPPAISSVAFASTPKHDADGNGTPDTFRRGEHIDVAVTWERDVSWDVSATNAEIRVRLTVGSTVRAATLVTGGATSGTARSLTFRYTVVQADADTDGVAVTATNAGAVVILRNGATLQDSESRAAGLDHAGVAADANRKVDGSLVPDTTPPTVSRAGVNGTALTITFNEPLGAAASLANGAFTVKRTRGGMEATVTLTGTPSISGNSVTLTLMDAAVSSDTFTVAYENPSTGTGNRLTDVEGNAVASFSARAVVNFTPSTTQPNISAAAVASHPRLDADSNGTNDTYGAGQNILIDVTWDQAVAWDTSASGAEIRMRLDIGGTTRQAKLVTGTATSGSGTKLRFSYTVVAADSDSDGFAARSTNAGDLVILHSGATLKSAASATTNARRRHPGLAAGAGHLVNGGSTAPTNRAPVFDFDNDPNTDDSDLGEINTPIHTLVRFQLTDLDDGTGFTDPDGDPLTVTYSAPRLDIYTSNTPLYSSAGNAVFVMAKRSCQLAALSPPLTVTSGTERTFSNAVTITATDPDGLSAQTMGTGVLVFPKCPEFSSATVEGAVLKVVLTDDADGGTPEADEFVVRVAGTAVSLATTDPVSVSDDTITLTLASAVTADQAVTVSYAPNADAKAASTFDGAAAAAAFSDQAVTHATTPATGAAPASVTANGAAVTMTFDEAMDTAMVPAGNAFTVTNTANGAALALATTTPVAVSGKTVTLALASALTADNKVAVRYDRPTAATATRLRTAAGDEVASFANVAAANDTPAAAPSIASVTIASTPSADADSNGTNDTYVRNEGILVRVTWTSDVIWDVSASGASMSVKLDVGGTERTAALLKGDATRGRARSLFFRYTVAAGDTDTDGVGVKTSTANGLVVLAGGATLKDAQDRNAARAHAAVSGGATHKVNGSLTPADAAPPVLVDATADGKTVTLTFDEDVQTSAATPTAKDLAELAFAFTIQGGRHDGAVIVNQGPHRVAVSGSTVTLTLLAPIAAHQPVTVYYRLHKTSSGTYTNHQLRDAAGNKVARFSKVVTNVTPPADPPVLLRGQVDGSKLTLVFDKGLDAASRPSGSRFRVSRIGEAFGYHANGTGTALVRGATATVTLVDDDESDGFNALAGSDGLWVFYDKGDDANPLRDTAGHEVEPIALYRISRLGDSRAPTANSGSVSGKDVTLYFDEALDETSIPAAGAFAVTVAGSTRTVSEAAVRGTAVFLTLASAAAAADAVTVAYTRPSENRLKDVAGNEVANVAAITLTNEGTTRPAAAPALAATNPATMNGNLLTLTFDQALDPTKVPDKSAFALDRGYRGVNLVTVRGKKVVLQMVRTAMPCDTFNLTYATPPANALQNRWGMEAGEFTGQAVTNAQAGNCVVNGNSGLDGLSGLNGLSGNGVTVKFHRPLEPLASPATAYFTVTPAAPAAAPVPVIDAGFAADGVGVDLTLGRTIADGEGVTVHYRRPQGELGLWTADHRQIADFDAEGVAGARAAVTGVAMASDPGDDETYAAGEKVRVQLTFGEAVDVDSEGGTPRLKLDLGGADGAGERWAAYESGSGTATLAFAWQAVAPDEAADGIAVLADTLELNGGTIKSAVTQADAALGHAGLAADPAHKVDAAPPRLVRGEIDGATMTLHFSEALDPDFIGGRFMMGIQTSETDSLGCYATGEVAVDGERATVGMGKGCPAARAGLTEDNDLIYFRRADGGDGAFRDLAGNLLAPDGDSGVGLYVRIDLANVTGDAGVTGVEVVSDAGADDTYALGEKVRVAVTFDKAVEVDTAGGTPALTVDMDPAEWGEKGAAYESGSGTDTLVFAHEVVEPNISTEGIAVPANSLALHGGTIRSAETQVDAGLGHAGLDHDPAHKVDWRLAPVPVAVTDVSVVSEAGADGAYTEGETIEASVTFDAPVRVETEGGAPTLALIANGGIRRAAYVSGSGTARLVFAYRAVEADGSLGAAVRVAASSLKLNGGAIVAAAGGAAASLGFGEAPGVTAVSVGTQPDGRWEAGDAVAVTLSFAEPVTVEGAPTVAVTFGDVERRASYARGSGGETLTFSYTLAEGEVWQGTLGLAGNSLDLGGGSILSAGGGLAAALAHPAVEGAATAPPPSVAAVAVLSDAGDDATYGLGERIRIRVSFTGAVTVTGTPGIGIDMDPAEWGGKRAVYESGSGSPTLVFVHEVVEPNVSTRGIAVLADSLDVDGGAAIRSTRTGDDAALGHDGLDHDPDHKVDWRLAPPTAAGSTPAVTAVAVVSDAGADRTYLLGDTIRVRLTFSEAVKVTGTPRLSIDMDPADWGTKQAAYEGAQDTAALSLTFAYTVVEPNLSTRGIAVLANSLDLNGGTIRSAAGTDAALGHAGLAHDPAHRVDWRPAVSVADAKAREGVDEAVVFEVSLDRAFTSAEHRVTVDYATADGTAKAGEDYTATYGILIFAAGETTKTVSVPILDDALDEGEETFTLRLSNATGARIGDGEAAGTIANDDPLQAMWLSRFGRTVADHVAGAVSDRLSNPVTGAHVTLGGQGLDLAESEDGTMEETVNGTLLDRTLVSLARIMGVPEGQTPGDGGWPVADYGVREDPTLEGAPVRSMTGREILLGSSFHLAGDSGDGGGTGSGMTAWGRVTTGGFDGEAPADGGNVRIDGEVTTGILGTDAKWGRVLAGIALSVSEGEGTFDQPGVDSGEIESTMTTGSPYARVDLNDRVSAWGMAGFGTGDMTIVQKANTATNQPERITRSDLSLRMAAVGGRGALMTPGQTGGMDLALRADAFLVQTESEAVSGEGATKADASRMRLILEGSRAFKTGNGATLTPGLELGLRHDGGDAETGTGVELGGRIAYANPETGLNLESNVRALVAHEDAGYEEWGASVALGMVPGDRGRGLSFSLAPTYGTPGSGVERLWSARDAGGLASGGDTFEPESRIEGEIGYGLPAFGDRFTGTPNFGFALADGGARDYRFGWRLAPAHGGSFEVSLDATRSEPAGAGGSGSAPEHAVVLRAGVRW